MNSIILCFSHAINQYLVSKYGKDDDPLYPKDLKKRGTVDQRLHFSNDIFYIMRRMTVRVVNDSLNDIFYVSFNYILNCFIVNIHDTCPHLTFNITLHCYSDHIQLDNL